MEKVLGIGGFFFRSRDPAALGRWYADHLGVDPVPETYENPPWRQRQGPTVFAPFQQDTDYFGRTEQQWMINFRVDDLEAMVAQLRAAGIAVDVIPNTIRMAGSRGLPIPTAIRSSSGSRKASIHKPRPDLIPAFCAPFVAALVVAGSYGDLALSAARAHAGPVVPAIRLCQASAKGTSMTTAAILMIIGRVIFGAFFLIAGVRNFAHFSERKVLATNYGWPLPAPLLAIGFAVQLVGGLSLVLGFWTVAGALMLIAFLIAATPLYHNLFMFQGKERDPHLYLTLVNITLCGGLLLVIADTM